MEAQGKEYYSMMQQAEVLPAIPEKKKPKRFERDLHRQALAFYFGLGESRSLTLVAEKFQVKESRVISWSRTFNWKRRVQGLEGRSQEDEFKEKAMGLLVMLLDSFSKQDEKTGKMVLTSTEKSIVEKLKLAVDSFKRLRDDSREQEDHSNENDSGRGGKPPGVMVNVFIGGKRIGEPANA